MNAPAHSGHFALASVLALIATTAAPMATAPAAAQPSTPRGLPACTNPLTDFNNWHLADLSRPALESTATPGAPRAMDNVTPTTSNPIRICWLGHYAGRVGPAAADESFHIRILGDLGGLPNPFEEPIFARTFRQSGAPGVDRLEMDCLDGQNCPGSTDPDAGGLWVYSAELAGGFPMFGNGCYWIEISNAGSAAAGVAWSWSASQSGVDLATLHGADGDYTVCDRASNDRAIALSGGVSPFNGTCFPIPFPPPICQLSSADGQPPIDYCDDPTPPTYSRSSSPGSIGGPTWTPALLADNFRIAQSGAVSGLCFFGAWLCPSGEAHCDPPANAATWDIAYYIDAGGIPGDVIASFHVGATPGVTYQWDGFSSVHVEHPAVDLLADQCYWLSIGRVQHGDGADSQWAWVHTTAGAVGDGSFATNVNGRWQQTRLPDGDGGAAVSNLAFLLSAGPVAAPACEPRDCNDNGIADAAEIADDPALDCFNPAGPPAVLGGPDGALDACQCPANWGRDDATNSSDISAFLTSWLAAVHAGSTDADVDCSGATDSSDISAFLTAWLAAVQDLAPHSGCP